MKHSIFRGLLLGCGLLLVGCASAPPYDYSAFNQAKPKTLLVLPPVNDSPEVKATASVWSHATKPLSEAGFYVLPVTLVDETLRQNGVQTAHDASAISHQKLAQVFGADAVVYIHISDYGPRYAIVRSDTTVVVEAKIVSLKTGKELWSGSGRASTAENSNSGQQGLGGMLVEALVKQVLATQTDHAYFIADQAMERMLGFPGENERIPYGPRSPLYGKPQTR